MEFLPLDSLITYGGALAATVLVVQLLKSYIPLETRLLSCIVAFVVLNAAAFGLSLWNIQFLLWSLFNAIIIGFAASGGYDAIMRAKSGIKPSEDVEDQGVDEPEA
jgi:hypothetical protein